MGQAGEELMAPLDFKHFTSVKYRPGESDETNYRVQKRKRTDTTSVDELSMKKDKNLPNLKSPVKGKKGISKFMRKKAIGQAKDDLNASVQSADKKPEKYIKPDGKVGVRMVKTDKEIINKESIDNHPKVKAARKAHAAGTWDGNVNKEGEAVVHINGKPHVVTNKSKTKNLRKEDVDEALNLQQRMKRSRLMKRMKSRIAVGRKRAMKKMANKKTIEKRALRQARNQIAQKLTRGIPKGELTFARKQEIEKRLAKPALQQRIKRIAKKLFKDVRKKELQRKKG
jgi:hypothetical protein